MLVIGLCDLKYLGFVDFECVVCMFDVLFVCICVVNEVELCGVGFLFDGWFVILFECYVFWKWF